MVADGGGQRAKEEDIDIVELPIEDAMRAIDHGEIVDGKTIMLLQHAVHFNLWSKGEEPQLRKWREVAFHDATHLSHTVNECVALLATVDSPFC